ncbi:MAG: hypothetical protein IJD43_08785 [Thermoguttaceae bacterium]|nr:hypothetical protein [Planctomycetaceae bacterium]MBQ4143555.1 hypothetical protein [Thermoguttaceae bacterium]
MKQIKCPTCGRITETETPHPGITCPNCSRALVGENAKISNVCFFCKQELRPNETAIFCPACGVEYHADCWLDNDGCGTEGCEYQDCLAPMELPAASTVSASSPANAQVSQSSVTQSAEAALEKTMKDEISDGEDDYFVIKSMPTAQDEVQTQKNEDALIEEKMAKIRKRAEMPEQKKLSLQDFLNWKDTPRDTKYDFDGPWLKDPYLFQKAKNYAIFLVGGAFGGAVLGVSFILVFLILKYIFLHSMLSFNFMVFLFIAGILLGMAAAVYFAYRTMATLIDN